VLVLLVVVVLLLLLVVVILLASRQMMCSKVPPGTAARNRYIAHAAAPTSPGVMSCHVMSHNMLVTCLTM